MSTVTEESIAQHGAAIVGHKEQVPENKWCRFFGVNPALCQKAWLLCTSSSDGINAEPQHLLWALLFLRSCADECVLSALVRTREETYLHQIWIIIQALANSFEYVVSKKRCIVLFVCVHLLIISGSIALSQAHSDSLGKPFKPADQGRPFLSLSQLC